MTDWSKVLPLASVTRSVRSKVFGAAPFSKSNGSGETKTSALPEIAKSPPAPLTISYANASSGALGSTASRVAITVPEAAFSGRSPFERTIPVGAALL